LASQAQKEVTHNDGLNRLDAFVTPVAKAILDAPPASPVVGDLYIVGSSPTGDFSGQAGKLAQYLTGGWVFYTPFQWMDAVVKETQSRMAWDGTNWIPFGLIMRDSGEYLRIERWQEDIDLSGSLQSTALMPNRSTVLATNVRVINDITGTGLTTFGIGVSGDTSRYGNSIGIGQDSTNVGLTYHPTSYYADTPLLVTPDAGVIDGGTLRVNVQYITFRGPWSW
jgi:hypothetical protein